MFKISNDENGFSVAETVIAVVILVLIGIVGYFVYNNNHKSTSISSKTSTTSTVANPYAGWKTATLSGENLSVKYPSDWHVANSSNGTLAIQKTADSGIYIVDLYLGQTSAETGTINGVSAVKGFEFNGRPAYIVEGEYNASNAFEQGMNVSSCAAPDLCFFPSKSTARYALHLTFGYSLSGATSEAPFPNDHTTMTEGEAILASLSY